MRMFVWKNTQTCSGTRFGGSICVIAHNVQEAKAKVRLFVEKNQKELFRFGLDEKISTSGETAGSRLEEDLENEPETHQVFIADGGDY